MAAFDRLPMRAISIKEPASVEVAVIFADL
jgi:hypothetical protein